MCGIAGYITEQHASNHIIKKMTDRIAHRGPDAEGFFVEGCCALGHRRLSIIDLSTGDQPIYNEDRSLVIVFNGEIYNYRELRKELEGRHVFVTNSDTEVLIHGYEEWGKDFTEKLRGMFAFAIFDRTKKELFLARDKWGIKPLYYYYKDGCFMFASEIKAFLDHPDFKKEFNENILAAYLCFNSTPTEETFFKNVYRLEPGCRLIYDAEPGQTVGTDRVSFDNNKGGRIKIEQYFELEFTETETDIERAAERIAGAMKESVEYHKIADVEVGSFLSSGIDSSYLVSEARPERTFTVGYEDKRYDEISYAKDLTEKLGISNTSKFITKEEYIEAFPDIIYHMDEPLADPAAIALYFAAMIASKEVKVVTSGEGADELFGGYLSYREEIDGGSYMKIPYPVRHMLAGTASVLPEFKGRNFIYRRGMKLEDHNIGLGRVFSDKEALDIVKNKDQVRTKDITAPYYERYKNNSDLVKRQVIDYYFWLVRDFLHAVDRNTMMFGLEARTPFLDDAVYEAARVLSVPCKINKETTKPALRMAASKVIPNDAYKKKKLGFPVPLREWMKQDDLHDKIYRAFSSGTAARFFDTGHLLKMLEEQRSGKKDNYKKVWTVYTFLVWYDVFFQS